MNKLDLEETTRRFHNVYEQVAKEYGYKTREDTKELDFNSPNGMTMLKTVETITTPYLEEIERLNKQIEGIREERDYLYNKYSTENKWLYEDLEKANNIIKEVMEQIIKDRKKNYGDLEKKAFYCNKTDKLLEILNKENINEENK